VPEIAVEFFASVGANHQAVLENAVLKVRLSDMFEDAPRPVLEAVAAILVSKLYGKKLDRHYRSVYKEYTTSEPMVERARRVRSERGRKLRTTDPRGLRFDLDRLFDEINAEYFAGSLPKPRLSWTDRPTRRVLGRYDFDHDVIFISRSLDARRIPEYVVRYVLYHEMLHVKHGSQIQNHREVFHSADFRREERRFEWFDVASEWLDSH
jgi:predicted metal-dependent hydrolase